MADNLSQSMPVVDLSVFNDHDAAKSQVAARELVAACHRFGFVAIKGHGLDLSLLEQAFQRVRSFFDLPVAVKQTASHPPTPRPHRGYSGIGIEKVYADRELWDAEGNGGADKLRRITDLKESYELGSEENKFEPNIYLAHNLLPGFTSFMLSFYEALDQISSRILEAVAIGLDLQPSETQKLMNMNSNKENQLRLLHYPSIEKAKLGSEVFARLPAHKDFSLFTLVFQDENGGLEFLDPQTKAFVRAEGTQTAVFLNVGEMLERVTNGFFSAAEHRVSVPLMGQLPDNQSSLPARYSIPYFVCPHHDAIVEPMTRFVNIDSPRRYSAVTFNDYASMITKYQYAYQDIEH